MVDATANERWLPIRGWEGSYEASDQGRVRSVDRVIRYANGQNRRYAGRIRRFTPDRHGHLGLLLGKRDLRRVHLLVLEAFVGPRPEGMEGCHWDDDKSNNFLSNLRWGTRSANVRDLVRNGRHHYAKRDRCGRGHLLVNPNLARVSKGRTGRNCLSCKRSNSLILRRKRRGAPCPGWQELSDKYYAEIMRSSVVR